MQETVQKYYGETLSGSHDLQTNACCTDTGLPEYIKPLLSEVHDEVLTRYYGCGLVLPEQLFGMTVLDLGCGAGRDVYALAQLVGEQLHAIVQAVFHGDAQHIAGHDLGDGDLLRCPAAQDDLAGKYTQFTAN